MGLFKLHRTFAGNKDSPSGSSVSLNGSVDTAPAAASNTASGHKRGEGSKYAHAGTNWDLRSQDARGEKIDPVPEGKQGGNSRLFRGPGLGIYR
jgi:hypothetical protein